MCTRTNWGLIPAILFVSELMKGIVVIGFYAVIPDGRGEIKAGKPLASLGQLDGPTFSFEHIKLWADVQASS